MTKREGAIISAYTGILIGSFDEFAKYSEELLGHPIWTHQYPHFAGEIKEKSKDEFMKLNIEIEG